MLIKRLHNFSAGLLKIGGNNVLANGDAVGGDFTGTLPNPTLGPGVVGDANVDLADPLGQDKLKMPEAWHTVGDAGEPAFTNANWGSMYGQTIQFRKHDNVVYLRGILGRAASVATDQLAFVFPVGYRPSRQLNFTISDINGTALAPFVLLADGSFSTALSTTGGLAGVLDHTCYALG